MICKKRHRLAEIDHRIDFDPFSLIPAEIHRVIVRIQGFEQLILVLDLQICLISIQKIHLFEISRLNIFL